MEEERKVSPACVNASNPFHVCAEYCAQRARGSKPPSPGPKLVGAAQNGEKREEDRGIDVAERNVDPSCRNASNPYHHRADYSSPRNPEVKGLKEEKRSVENGVKMVDNQKKKEIEHTEGGETAQNGERHKDDLEIVIAKRNVDASCSNVSNAEHCSEIKPEVKRHDEKRSVKHGMKMWDNGMVDRRCVNASNPYHVCAEYCLQKSKEMEHAERHKSVVMVQNGVGHKEDQGIVVAERNVDPLCPNASNPYHHCAEYCLSKKT